MQAERLERGLETSVAVAAALSVGYDWSKPLWHAGVPWVPGPFQDVTLTASALGLLTLAPFGALLPGSGLEESLSREGRLVAVCGALLLGSLGLSAIGAPAPLLALARAAEVAVGLLAYLAVARRPRLAHGLLIGFTGLVLLQLPIITLQETTQSTFPVGQYLYGWGTDVSAQVPGDSVVFGNDGTRWQRALGSFPHPNVLGGFIATYIVLGLCGPRALRPGRKMGTVIWAIAWTELLFTFSRAALLAALVGCASWALGNARIVGRGRSLVYVALPAFLALGIVGAASGPFLEARLVPSPGQLSSAPVAGRLLLLRIAIELVKAHPLLGIGAGNFSLVETMPPFSFIAVDPVHVVPLLIASEAGIPAGLAWLGIVLGVPILAWSHRRRVDPGARAWLAIRLALPLAILTLGLLDHYLWTLAPGRALFWLTLGSWRALQTPAEESDETVLPSWNVARSDRVGAPM